MTPPRLAYTVGTDFGTECARAFSWTAPTGGSLRVARTPTGRDDGGDERPPAPDNDVLFGPDWALQDLRDCLRTVQVARPEAAAWTGLPPGTRAVSWDALDALALIVGCELVTIEEDARIRQLRNGLQWTCACHRFAGRLA